LRELAFETAAMVHDSKRLPHAQRGTDVNQQVAVGNDCSSCSYETAYLKLVVSGAGSRTIDIYSKIGAGLKCERSYAENRRGVSAISRGKVCSCVDYCAICNCAGSAKCCASVVDRYILRANAGTSCVGPAEDDAGIMILLDTNVIVDAHYGVGNDRTRARNLISSAIIDSGAAINCITLAELYAGTRRGDERRGYAPNRHRRS
jgi:hypothetical protein